MTIDWTIFLESDSLIKSSPRNFYPSKIPRQHHQLRNFISTADPDIIYYASRQEIYSLQVSTQRRKLIVSLSWKPQCLGAGCGWICVGGDDRGRCAFIDIGESKVDGSYGRAASPYTEVDALLPLDLDPEPRIHEFLYHRNVSTPSTRRRPKVHYHDLGTLIVNSITVHQFRGNKDGLKNEVVAVLTNNDKTVRIFSLTQSRILQALEFPTPLNHATISPNGELLVVAGDEPRAFFCRRSCLPNLTNSNEPAFAKYKWHRIAEPRLSLATCDDCCFSTAFSPSGYICAVASQAGTITIFDTRLIRDDMETDEAVIDVLTSSRPCIGTDSAGAIRSMSFSPEPWDLFAWAEDRGRVCVTDLRYAFRSRQTIDLDTQASNVERVEISDFNEEPSMAEQRQLEIEARFIQRHREALDAQDHLAAVNHAADYMELAAERHRLQRELRENEQVSTIHDQSSHLSTDEERRIIESLRVERQRHIESGEERNGVSQHPFSVHYSRPLEPGFAHRSGNAEAHLSPTVRNTSIHEYMRERDLGRTRPTDRSYQPRRRSSVVISSTTSSNPSFMFHPSSLAPIGSTTSTLSTSPSRLTSSATTAPTTNSHTNLPRPTSTTDPWQTISAAMVSTPALDAVARLRREREVASALSETSVFQRRMQQQQQQQLLRTERLQLERMRRYRETVGEESLYDDYELEMLRRVAGIVETGRGRNRDEGGLWTMGLDWSGDGRFLYVGSDEGIMEFGVNLQERKTFPSTEFR